MRVPKRRASLSSVKIPEPKAREEMDHFPCLHKLKAGSEPLPKITSVYGEEIKGFQVFSHNKPFVMRHGGSLPRFELAYETWGKLNEARDNAILIHTGLSASSHARSHPDNTSNGWWEKFVGPGAPVNTDKYFVICSNVLGGCFGSSGPSSIDPATDKPYGVSFPLVTVEDMIRAQFLLLDHLGIEKLHTSVGASLGGMQSVCAASMYPDRVSRVVSISGALRAHPSSIAFRFIQRRILMSDPNWKNGDYYGKSFPLVGMQNARALATITYRSAPEWEGRFVTRQQPDQVPNFCPDFEVEHYLEAAGDRFCTSYDPNSLLYISKAMDLFNLGEDVSKVECPVLVLGVVSDILFPVVQQREMVKTLREAGNSKVVYFELNSLYGHDTFLLDVNSVGSAIKGHIESTL